MAFDESRLVIEAAADGKFTSGERVGTKETFLFIYNTSALAAAAIDAWLAVDPNRKIEIKHVLNNAQATPNGGVVFLDPTWLSNNRYMSTSGKVVADTLASCLAHELGHALTGLLDNDSFSDLAGNNLPDK